MRAPVLAQAPAPAASVVLRGARILDPAAGIDRVGDLVVRDGRIGGDPGGAEVVDAAGLVVIPGLVDPHVHLRTPGREDTEDIASGTRAAAAGGFVAIAAMPNTRPPVDRASILGSLIEIAEREAVVPVGFIAAITVGQEGVALTEQVELAEAGAVAFSDDGVPVHDAAVMRRALQYQQIVGRPLVLHEEDPALSGGGVAHEGAAAGRLGLRGIPAVSESVAVARDAALAAFEDGRIHVCHVSAAATVEEIRLAKSRGVAITAEVTPHHLLLDDRVLDELDPARHKMNPPLRSAEDREALIAALIDGTLDCIATDHAPHAANEKDVPFAEAPFGVTGLETSFAACHTALVREGSLDLETLVRRMSTDAARVIDLEPPTLAEGAVANLAVVDPEAEWTVGEEPFQSKSTNSAFLGRTFAGRVEMTIAGGREAFRRLR